MTKKSQPPADPHRAPLVRPSLAAETLAELRRRIEDGVFVDQLPGERTLCEHLGVSRPTLRLALEELQREGLIAGDATKARRILTCSKPKAVRQEMRVVFLRSSSMSSAPVDPALEYYLAHQFQMAGYDFMVKLLPPEALAEPGATLRHLVSHLRPKLWILMSCPLTTQRWFQEHHLPCLLFGSAHPGIDYPFLGEDNRTMCRHACGLMLAAGHTHLGLILPEPMLPGDRESREGFLEGLALSPRKGLQSSIVHSDGTPESTLRAVRQLLAQEQVPGAWLVCKPFDCLTVLSYLLAQKHDVPGEISLVCRTSRMAIRHLVPTVARYERNHGRFQKKLLQMALILLKEGVLATREHRIASDFVPGESLGPAKDRRKAGKD